MQIDYQSDMMDVPTTDENSPVYTHTNLPTLIQSSSKIFSKSVPLCISPQDYMTMINDFLERLKSKSVKNSCSVQNTLPKLTTELSERLLFISRLEYILRQSIQENIKFNYTLAENDLMDSSDGNVSDPFSLKKDDNTYQESDGDNFHYNSTNSNNSAFFSETTYLWCKKTSCLLLENDDFIYIMMQCHQNGCVFESHLAKKVLIACVKSNSSKINVVLKCTQDFISKHPENAFQMFDLLCEFVSSRSFGRDSSVFNCTCDWFATFCKENLLMSLSKVLEKKFNERKFKEPIDCFSFLTKMLKHRSEKCRDILDEVLKQAFYFFTKCWKVSDLDQYDKSPSLYVLTFKIIKLLNVAFDLDIILKKEIISTTILEIAIKAVRSFSDLFTSLRPAYLSADKSFWGDFDQVTRSRDKTQKRHQNRSVARQFLLVSLKACLFSVFSDSFHDLEVGQSVCLIMNTFKMWLHDQESEFHASEWLPTFLGDQDDQWIAALLCLLLIYMNLNREKRTSEPQQQLHLANHPVKSSSEQHENTYYDDAALVDEQYTSSSCSLSKHDSNWIEIVNSFCPHRLFLQFVKFIVYDHHVIADLLLSPETYFLAYFTKYLSVLNDEWDIFYSICKYVNVNKTSIIECKDNENTELTCRRNYVVKKAKNFKNSGIEIDENNDSQYKKAYLEDCSSPSYSSNYDNDLEDYSSPSYSSNYDNDNHEGLFESDDLMKHTPKKKIKLNDLLHVATQNYETNENFSDWECQEEQKITFPLVSYTDSESSDTETNNNENLSDTDTNTNCLKSGIIYDNKCLSSPMTEPSKGESDNQGCIDSLEGKKKIYSLSTEAKSCSQILSRSHSSISNSSSSLNINEDEDDDDDALQNDFNENFTDQLETCMTMMIRLQLHLERLDNRCLIPFHAHLLLRLLNSCVDKYES